VNPRAGLAEPILAEATLSGQGRDRVAAMPGAASAARPPVRRCGAPTCTPLGSPCRWALHRGPCPHHQHSESAGRCTATVKPLPGMKRRERCLAWPVAGTSVCPGHSPERIEQRREQAVLRRAAEARQRSLAALKPVRDLLALVLELFDSEFEGSGAHQAHTLRS
jgi:hypothetical protein